MGWHVCAQICFGDGACTPCTNGGTCTEEGACGACSICESCYDELAIDPSSERCQNCRRCLPCAMCRGCQLCECDRCWFMERPTEGCVNGACVALRLAAAAADSMPLPRRVNITFLGGPRGRPRSRARLRWRRQRSAHHVCSQLPSVLPVCVCVCVCVYERDVKRSAHHVCRKLPSAFLCEQKERGGVGGGGFSRTRAK